jgi:hypothetical protein
MGRHPKPFTGADLYCVASGWLGRLGAGIRIGLLFILTAKRQALAIGYLAKIASIRFERLDSL